MLFQCMSSFLREKKFSADTCAANVATQMTIIHALVMCFCVPLLLKRGATTPSSLNTVKITNEHVFVTTFVKDRNVPDPELIVGS